MARKIKGIVKSVVRRVRQMVLRALGLDFAQNTGFIGQHGCVRCAASFVAWNQVEGDYLEFGVYRGASFAEAYRAIWNKRSNVRDYIDSPEIEQWYQRRPRFVAFDSFTGLPGGEAERHADYEKGAYSCSEDTFLSNIKNAGVDLGDVVTLPGFFDKTLTPESKEQLNLKKASLVLIDCDLYESTVPVLNFITDLVGQGTIIIFDDWYRYKGSRHKGEQRACREWLEKNPDIALEKFWQQGPQAVAFLVHRE
jgi:O-methyltransferase